MKRINVLFLLLVIIIPYGIANSQQIPLTSQTHEMVPNEEVKEVIPIILRLMNESGINTASLSTALDQIYYHEEGRNADRVRITPGEQGVYFPPRSELLDSITPYNGRWVVSTDFKGHIVMQRKDIRQLGSGDIYQGSTKAARALNNAVDTAIHELFHDVRLHTQCLVLVDESEVNVDNEENMVRELTARMLEAVAVNLSVQAGRTASANRIHQKMIKEANRNLAQHTDWTECFELVGIPTPFPNPSPVNSPPIINDLIAKPFSVIIGGQSTISIDATDPDGDPLIYDWITTCGTLSSISGADDKTWTAPNTPGTCTVSVDVTDPSNESDIENTEIDVFNAPPLQQISSYSDLQLHPNISASGSNLHIVWSDDNTTSHENLYYRRSTNGGLTFNPIQTISESTTGIEGFFRVLAFKSNVIIVWCKENTVFVRRSSNSGRTFDTPEFSMGTGCNPNIAVSDQKVSVVFYNGLDVLYRRSTDGGENFSPIVNISNNPPLDTDGFVFPTFPVISMSGDNIAIVWTYGEGSRSDESDPVQSIFFRGSTDGGATFNPVKDLSVPLAEYQIPSVVVSNSIVAVVWDDNDHRVIFKGSQDSGATFGPIKTLSNGDSGGPFVIANNGIIHTVWVSSDVSYRRSLDGGVTFEPAHHFSHTRESIGTPQLAINEDSTVAISWHEFNFDSTNSIYDSDIFFVVSTDNGASFTDAKNISDTVDPSFMYPVPGLATQLALSNTVLGIVWLEGNPGTDQAIFARGATLP